MTSEIRPGEMSPDEEREYALDQIRDEMKDELRTTTWQIDLLGPTDREAEADDEREVWRRREAKRAQERVGRSDKDRMEWLVRFASRDLSNLSAKAYSDLCWETLAFAAPPAARFIPCEVYLVEGEIALGSIEVRTLHAWLQSGFRGLRKSPYVVVDEKDVASDGPREWRVDVKVKHRFAWVDDQLIAESEGDSASMTNRFKAQVSYLFAQQADRIRICQNRDCANLFIANKRQIYCSIRCSNITRKRRERERDHHRRPVASPQEQALLGEIEAMRRRGRSLRSIFRVLAARGAVMGNGRPLSLFTLRKIVRNWRVTNTKEIP